MCRGMEGCDGHDVGNRSVGSYSGCREWKFQGTTGGIGPCSWSGQSRSLGVLLSVGIRNRCRGRRLRLSKWS